MAKPSCLVHYKFIKFSDNLTPVSEKSLETLIECKKIRQKLAGENGHDEQCNNIPEELAENQYFYHRECYQKFVYAKTLLKRKTSHDNNQIQSSKVKRSTTTAGAEGTDSRGRFPNVCMICKKEGVIQVKRKRQSLSKILTKSAELTLKDAASMRNGKEMLIAVKDTDLIAKDFQKHESCYRDYTRIVWRSEPAELDNSEDGSGDFNAVCGVIEENILKGQQCISMDTLMVTYGIGLGVRQRRQGLKERLLKAYPEKLVFFSPEYHYPQVVISKQSLGTQSLSKSLEFSDEYAVKKAASVIREAVLKLFDNASPLPWPPTVSSLQSVDRQPPSLLVLFFKTLLTSDRHHAIGEVSRRLIDSFSQDVLNAISKGNFLTLKHASLGLGLHSLTGQKLPLTVLARLGHSINYDKVSEIETAQAELAEHFQTLSLGLPLYPADEGSKVRTLKVQFFLGKYMLVFWLDAQLQS